MSRDRVVYRKHVGFGEISVSFSSGLPRSLPRETQNTGLVRGLNEATCKEPGAQEVIGKILGVYSGYEISALGPRGKAEK